MPIKKSFLEQKIYYRIAKVFFLILPLLAAVFLFAKEYMNMPGFLGQNIFYIFYDVLQQNNISIVYVLIGLAAYYIILKVIWRLFLYIAFGGLKDDTKKKKAAAAQPATRPSPTSANNATQSPITPADKKEIGFLVFILIMIVLLYLIVTYKSPSPSPNPIIDNTCVPTGCGKSWHSSCTNKCYPSLSDCRKTQNSGCSNLVCRQYP